MQRSATWLLGVTLAAASGNVGCGDDTSSTSTGGGGGAGGGATTGTSTAATGPTTTGGEGGQGGSGSGGGGVTPPPTSDLAPGWEKAFGADPVAITCDATALTSGAPSLTIDGSTIVVGYEQLGDNQDPVVARFDGDTLVWCERHEQEPPDGRALGLVWDGGDKAHVIFTVVGGGTRFEEVAQGGWIEAYGDGGGSSKVAFLGELATATGNLVRGTFVLARKEDGGTNTWNPTDAPIRRSDALIEVHGDSAFQPIDPDGSIMECTDYPFFSKVVLAADLSRAICAESTSCIAAEPCD